MLVRSALASGMMCACPARFSAVSAASESAVNNVH